LEDRVVIINSLKEGLRGGGREGRVCLTSAVILSLSVYISAMAIEVSLLIITLSAIVTSGRSLKVLKAFLPFYVFFAITAIFFGFQVVKSLLAFMAVISAGALIYSTNIKEITGALLYFKVPQRVVSVVSLAISMLPLLVSDFNNIREIHNSKGIKGYYRLLKAFTSTTILRAISISESLYSKSFSYRAVGELRQPEIKDIAVFLLSVLILIYAISLEVST
jgi:energy-coupling factor transport system permease protein